MLTSPFIETCGLNAAATFAKERERPPPIEQRRSDWFTRSFARANRLPRQSPLAWLQGHVNDD